MSNFYAKLEKSQLAQRTGKNVVPYKVIRDRTAVRMTGKTIIFPASTDAKLVFIGDPKFLRVTFRNIGANYAAIGNTPNTAYDNAIGVIFGAGGGPPAQGEQLVVEANENIYIQTPSGTTLQITTEAAE